MADPFVAEIRIFPFNFAPRGWAFCNGQLLPLSQNTALFSLLGTTYGGDGKSNFALPDLQGCAPLHPGQQRDDDGRPRDPNIGFCLFSLELGKFGFEFSRYALTGHCSPSAINAPKHSISIAIRQ